MDKVIHLKRRTLYWQLVAIVGGTQMLSEFGIESAMRHVLFGMTYISRHLVIVGLDTAIATFLIGAWMIWRWAPFAELKQQFMETHDDYQSLFEHNPYAVFSLNQEGRIISVNPSFQKLTGYTQQDLDNRDLFSLVTDQEQGRLTDCVRLALKGSIQRIETHITTKAGHQIVVDITYQPKYRSHEIVGAYAVAQDLTPRRQVEQELYHLKGLFASLVESTRDAILMYDTDLTVIHVNPAFEQTYGWTCEELVGKPLPPLIPHELDAEAKEMISTVLSKNAVYSKETVRLCKDGKRLDVNVTMAPIRDEDGNITAIAGVSRDITVRKRMARELEEAQHRFRSFVLNTADAISMIDLDGKLRMVNPAWEKLYGWKAEEVIGKTGPVTEWDKDRFSETLKLVQGGEVLKLDVHEKRKDGADIEVSNTYSPVTSSDGKLVYIATISKELTELRQAEARMMDSAKLAMVGELAAGIAHEIRNPLTSIQGFLQLMRSHFDPAYIDVLLPEVKRIDDITNELLLLSKPQHDERSPVDIQHILRDVVTLMEPQANMHNVLINKKFVEGTLPIMCARNQIKQAFINIIKNAIEAMPHGGNIEVEVQIVSSGVLVRVADEGIGIPAHRLKQLGEPFYTTKDRGTGLGLMVTYRVIQKHNGTITVNSKRGKGTSIEIVFPAVLMLR